TGQTRCGRRGLWHVGHALTLGAAILCCARRLLVRAWDCFCFGTAMAAKGSVQPPVRLRPLTLDDAGRAEVIAFDTMAPMVPDPRAMRCYARAGFELRPAVAAAGIVDRTALPPAHPEIRPGTGDDLALTERASRAVRGATHAPDLPNAIDRGDELLVLGDRGF